MSASRVVHAAHALGVVRLAAALIAGSLVPHRVSMIV